MNDYKEYYDSSKGEETMASKQLEPGSVWDHLDTDGDGIITDSEMSRAKEIAEFEHRRKMQDNEDKKEEKRVVLNTLSIPNSICVASGPLMSPSHNA